QGKYFYPVFCIFVSGIKPKLVILVRRGLFGIQPYRSTFCFSELVAIGFLDELGSKSIRRTAFFPADKLRTRNDVAPLVGPSHLEGTAVVFPEVEKIITLYQLVGKLGKRQAIFTF